MYIFLNKLWERIVTAAFRPMGTWGGAGRSVTSRGGAAGRHLGAEGPRPAGMRGPAAGEELLEEADNDEDVSGGRRGGGGEGGKGGPGVCAPFAGLGSDGRCRDALPALDAALRRG